MKKLFYLVKSMNAMEKRYFKLAVSVHKEADSKNYMRLFNIISQQDVYDEATWRKEFKSVKILKRFDMAKNYLYRLVLNTLQNYHKESSAELQLTNMLSRAIILYNRAIYKSSMEILQKARQLAKQYEYYEILLKIIQMMIQIAIEEKKDAGSMEQFHKEHQYALERIQRINEYRKLYHQLYSFFTKKGNDLRMTGLRKQYESFLQHPLLADEKIPNGYEEKIYYFLAYGLCYFCLGKTEKSYQSTLKRLKLIESRPERITESPDAYITALNSVIFYGSVLYKFKEAENTFDKLQQFLLSFPTKQHKIFVAYDNMMALYLTAGLFREGLVYATKAEKELKSFEHQLFASNKVSLYHDMFYIYFGCSDYDQSLIWLNKLLNETALGVREDIQVTARLTNLILHYELKNFDLLPHLLKRTYSFLHKRKRLHKLEKILLQYMDKLLRVNPHIKKDIIRLFAEIREALKNLIRKPDEAKILVEYFDYISWLESKIENRPFAEIVKEKVTRKNKF